ncbi:MAG TPA: thioredoxin [Candidatus Marinimicrobia bacterium]|nr:thioredoxin [Candidatus Neomarinimicrobiota bacterium]HRS52696.1 thioredoxin [Candidatus Neomarinimicrobiota bacterium]
MSEKLTKARFLKEIFDFENENAWKYKGELPSVIDFYADWCYPCKMVAPVLEELSKKYAGKVNIYKVNTDEESELAEYFGIRSIPSLLFIPKSGKPQMLVGALPKNQLDQAIQNILIK